MVVFSVDSKRGFENALNKWAPEAGYHCPRIPILFVGVKYEVGDSETPARDKEEGTQDAVFQIDMLAITRKKLRTKLVREIEGSVGYFECDLMTLNGVKEVFAEVRCKSFRLKGMY